MSRSSKKGPFVNEKLMKKVSKALESGERTVIKTWARPSVITPEMVGLTFGVHNGKEHINVLVTENMVGHRLGEFSATRKFRGHAKKGKLAKVYGSSGRFE
jgi:small subunit ribosomal protein S19